MQQVNSVCRIGGVYSPQISARTCLVHETARRDLGQPFYGWLAGTFFTGRFNGLPFVTAFIERPPTFTPTEGR